MRNKIEFMGEVYPSSKALEERVRTELRKFPLDSFIPKDKEDFFRALLDRHPDKVEKIGSGIAAFKIAANALNKKAIALFIHRTDGSVIDVSWRICVSGKKPTASDYLSSALREAVWQQCNAFKQDEFKRMPFCSICDAPLGSLSFADIHVDHVVPFKELATVFLFKREVPTKFSDSTTTNGAIFRKEDESFKLEWELFHELNAQLRLLCASCNLRRSKWLQN